MSTCGCYLVEGTKLSAPCNGVFSQTFELCQLPSPLTGDCVVLEFTLQRIAGGEVVVLKSSQDDGITILGEDTFQVDLDQADLALCPGEYVWCLKLWFTGKIKQAALTVDIAADGTITLTPAVEGLLVNDLLKVVGAIAGNTTTVKYDGTAWPQTLTQELGASGAVHTPLAIDDVSGLSGQFVVRDC